MWKTDMIKGKQVLIVDDEPDILESLEDELEVCKISKAATFEAAKEMLEAQQYDAAILDIMGVRGYDLLQIAIRRGIPAIMLTAHALAAEDFIKSMKTGAYAYVPKDEVVGGRYPPPRHPLRKKPIVCHSGGPKNQSANGEISSHSAADSR
jgi:CheY-like chemotaxis protein